MKYKLLIFLALVFVSILLIVFIKKTAPIATVNEPAPVSVAEENATSNPSEVTKSGQAVVCTFSTSDANGSGSGTNYVSGNKSNSVFKTKTPEGVDIEINSIVDDEWIYTWVTGESRGTKTKVPEAPSQDTTADNAEAAPTTTAPADYKCLPWTVDNSRFILPNGMEFGDITDGIK